jgi:3-deoxy-D-manno-octulosonate 8-phosphate phosphatase (KDO 8-P phosphatase)
MSFFKEELKKVKAFAFDLDGVLSKDTSQLNNEGEPVRTANVKDGFAIKNAIEMGFPVVVITGCFIDSIRLRYKRLGVKFYYQNISDKVTALNDFLQQTELRSEEVLFMGDDLVDLQVMKMVGIAVCPNDAVADIKKISAYISHKNGGEGCVRDVIEQTLRAQDKWFLENLPVNKVF